MGLTMVPTEIGGWKLWMDVDDAAPVGDPGWFAPAMVWYSKNMVGTTGDKFRFVKLSNAMLFVGAQLRRVGR